MHALTLPAGTVARLHILARTQAEDFPFVVVLAPTAERATPDAFFDCLGEPGSTPALLTHDEGLTWTDRAGQALLTATLQRGGSAMMAFATLVDAMACHTRARGAVE